MIRRFYSIKIPYLTKMGPKFSITMSAQVRLELLKTFLLILCFIPPTLPSIYMSVDNPFLPTALPFSFQSIPTLALLTHGVTKAHDISSVLTFTLLLQVDKNQRLDHLSFKSFFLSQSGSPASQMIHCLIRFNLLLQTNQGASRNCRQYGEGLSSKYW